MQPILVDTATRRDHEVPIRYRDDDGWHDLVDVAGPDRVSGGEWESAFAREYFKCVREDGMLVIPKDALDEVLAKSEEAKDIEDKVRAEVQAGIPVIDVYNKYGRL